VGTVFCHHRMTAYNGGGATMPELRRFLLCASAPLLRLRISAGSGGAVYIILSRLGLSWARRHSAGGSKRHGELRGGSRHGAWRLWRRGAAEGGLSAPLTCCSLKHNAAFAYGARWTLFVARYLSSLLSLCCMFIASAFLRCLAACLLFAWNGEHLVGWGLSPVRAMPCCWRIPAAVYLLALPVLVTNIWRFGAGAGTLLSVPRDPHRSRVPSVSAALIDMARVRE